MGSPPSVLCLDCWRLSTPKPQNKIAAKTAEFYIKNLGNHHSFHASPSPPILVWLNSSKFQWT